VRFVAAIVLVLWTACYGRCFGEQVGMCEPECCADCIQTGAPSDRDSTPCDVCDFIQSGATMIEPVSIPAIWFEIPAPADVVFDGAGELDGQRAVGLAVLAAPPPRCLRLWEWMARTAFPVRGPNVLV
jgi:hypothetical protein